MKMKSTRSLNGVARGAAQHPADAIFHLGFPWVDARHSRKQPSKQAVKGSGT
jgi:hypothetical protein